MPRRSDRPPARLRTRRLALRPLGPAMGAEITGIDLTRPLDEATFAEVAAALDRYLLLCFRGTAPAAAHLVDFSRRFGTPDAVALPAAAGVWRTAGTASGAPARLALLRGGDDPAIRFANLRIALETLSAEARTRLAGLTALYRTDDPDRPLAWPLVHRDAATGRETLCLDPAALIRLDGDPELAAGGIQARLLAHATRGEFQYRHLWQPGDVLVWDPRGTIYETEGDGSAAGPDALAVVVAG